MGLSKTEAFTDRQNQLAALAKALAHPARIAILDVLAKRASCVCGDIVDELPLSQATISQHLKELKAAGLITGEIEGRTVCYCIDKVQWEATRAMLSELFDQPVCAPDCC